MVSYLENSRDMDSSENAEPAHWVLLLPGTGRRVGGELRVSLKWAQLLVWSFRGHPLGASFLFFMV